MYPLSYLTRLFMFSHFNGAPSMNECGNFDGVTAPLGQFAK